MCGKTTQNICPGSLVAKSIEHHYYFQSTMSEQSPSLSMKVVAKSIGMRWPKVSQMSTTTLDSLLANPNHSVILLVLYFLMLLVHQTDSINRLRFKILFIHAVPENPIISGPIS